MKVLTAALLPFLGHYFGAAAAPLDPRDDALAEGIIVPKLTLRADKVPLRIMPLGASIVHGVGSSDENGFRKPLREQLMFDGFQVDMVGTERGGNMPDPDNHGFPGKHIKDLTDGLFARGAGFKPNLIVLNVGTNDANGHDDVPNAGKRMKDLLHTIWNQTDMADTCVLMSTIIPGTKNIKTGTVWDQAAKDSINFQYRSIYNDLAPGYCLYLAEMDPPSPSPAERWLLGDIIDDGIHPNDNGHRKMAYVFWQSIIKAYNDGRIKEAAKLELGDQTEGCDKLANQSDHLKDTQLGYGFDDEEYRHAAENKGTILEIESDFDRNQWRFARLYSREYDDLVGWFNQSATEHRFGVWKNAGAGKFTKIQDLDPDLFCNPAGVNFIDMTGDGLDDLVCIDPDGDAYLSVNQADGTATKPPTFKKVTSGTGGSAKIKTNEGFKQDRVVLGDIDGDGRGDYGVLDDKGNIQFWRNSGVNKQGVDYWQSLGTRFTAKGKGDYRGVRFEDINGDGRDDWMWVSDTGEIETWTNTRSCVAGELGDGLNCVWRQGFLKGETSGYTHFGVHVEGVRERIHLARIYGEKESIGLQGKQDYVYMEHTKPAKTGDKHKFSINVFKNVGSGGAKVKSDGNKYCNMLGHTNGAEDYVWTLSSGRMTLFPNIGRTTLSSGQSFWGPKAVIWDPTKLAINKELDRRDIHLMHWDNDDYCDIVWVDPEQDNLMYVWLNKYGTTKDWDNPATWEYHGPSSATSVRCKEEKGLGIYDLPVQFADIDGNGRDDYMCMERDGRITAFMHNDDNTWTNLGQVKFAQDPVLDRANLRFSDVNGDGKDDLLWVDKFTGNAIAYYNRGEGDPAKLKGSHYIWDRQDTRTWTGSFAGSCQFFPDLDGNGRSDLHSIKHSIDNTADSWLSRSCGLKNTEATDGGYGDPNLPVMPGTIPVHVGEPGGGGGGSGGGGGTGTSPARSCNAGHGPGALDSACQLACKYNFCVSPCTCDQYGPAQDWPPETGLPGTVALGGPKEWSLVCEWACPRGVCPGEACIQPILPGSHLATCPNKPKPKLGQVDSGCCDIVDWSFCNAMTMTTTGSYDFSEVPSGCGDGNRWRCKCSGDHELCDAAGPTDVALTNKELWDKAYSQEALVHVTDWYRKAKADAGTTIPTSLSHLTQAVMSQFGGAFAYNETAGGVLSEDACHRRYDWDGTFFCDVMEQQNGCVAKDCKNYQYPAMHQIAKSFANFYEFHYQSYKSFGDSDAGLKSLAEQIHKDFTVPNSPSILELLETVLGVVETVTSITGASAWEHILSGSALDFLGKSTEAIESAHEAINQGIEVYGLVAGEAKTAAEKDEDDISSLEGVAHVLAQTAKKSLALYFDYIYKGTEDSNKFLVKALQGGLYLHQIADKVSDFDMEQHFTNVTAAKMVQAAWGLGESQWPALLYDDTGVRNPTDSLGAASDHVFYDSEAEDSACGDLKALNGFARAAWLVNVNVPPELCNNPRGCPAPLPLPRTFTPLKGRDILGNAAGSDKNPYNFEWKDLCSSAFRGYVKAGNKNPFGVSAGDDENNNNAPSNPGFLKYGFGVATPGYIQVPVCHFRLALNNYYHAYAEGKKPADVCPEWPCCKIAWDSRSGCEGKNDYCE